MFKKARQGYWFFKEFKKFKGLIHGFSSRRFGDMRVKKSLKENKNLDKFLWSLNLQKKNLVLMEQVHGNKIKVVNEDDKGKIIPGIDGMVTNTLGIVLGVKTADCLPILFYDPADKIIGVAHAGWQGVLKRIGQKMVDLMVRHGSSPLNILVGVGPHIGGCCYTVSQQRRERFLKEFGELGNMVYSDKKGIYLDLMVPMMIQLIHSGVLKENIFPSLTCTSCQNQEFFSYRKDSKQSYGEMLATLNTRLPTPDGVAYGGQV